MKILISGASGTGKTTIADSINNSDILIIHGDAKLSHWIHPITKEPVVEPYPIPPNWRIEHLWVWDRDMLAATLDSPGYKHFLLFGNASNQADCYEQFDKIVFLYANAQTIRRRIATRSNNDYGRRPEEIVNVLTFNEQIKKTNDGNYIKIDCDRPLNTVVSELLLKLE